MASTTTSVISGIITRIEWCRKQRTKARTQPELEGWRAEEEGLRDAILDREHTNQYRYSPPAVSERYALGLEDGRALIRLARVDLHLAAGRQDEESLCTSHGDSGEESGSSIGGSPF